MKKDVIEAVEKSIIVWREIVRTGVLYKYQLSEEIFALIQYEENECPLCTLFYNSNFVHRGCKYCPLESCYVGTLYDKWSDCKGDQDRKGATEYAKQILHKLEVWLEEN